MWRLLEHIWRPRAHTRLTHRTETAPSCFFLPCPVLSCPVLSPLLVLLAYNGYPMNCRHTHYKALHGLPKGRGFLNPFTQQGSEIAATLLEVLCRNHQLGRRNQLVPCPNDASPTWLPGRTHSRLERLLEHFTPSFLYHKYSPLDVSLFTKTSGEQLDFAFDARDLHV
jgi:hypothetical protein